jgi:hypothetical protein
MQFTCSVLPLTPPSFAVLGYLTFGSGVKQIILDELPDNVLSLIVRVGLLAGVVFTYPLQVRWPEARISTC